MISRTALILSTLALGLALTLAGCAPSPATGPKPAVSGSAAPATATGDVPSPAGAPSASVAPPTGSSAASPTASPAQSASPKPSPSAAKPSSTGPVDAVWTMVVDQTIPRTVDGMTVNNSLVLVAQKTGGKDVNGTYKGSAYIGVNFDASQLSSGLMQALGGFNVNASTYDLTFEVVGYDAGPYTDYGHKGDLPPLAPLVGHESMALLTPQMTGTGSLNTSITAPNVQGGTSNSASSSTAVLMKITVDSGKVSVLIPSMQLTRSFEGTLIGTPLNGSSPDSQVQNAATHIKSLMDQASKAAAAGSGPDLSGILSQFKP